MVEWRSSDRVMPVHDLRDYFRRSIDAVIAEQGVDVDEHATHYVVNMMTLFARSDALYEDDGEIYGLRPLAVMLADATDAPSPEARNQTLQRIGDVALFVAGFFVDSFRGKPFDVDYYIHMGENAYGSLADAVRGTFRGNTFAPIYIELAEKFQVYTDVLNAVRDGACAGSDTDLLRCYEIWLRTGSRHAERQLRRQGVVPLDAFRRTRH